MSSNNSERNQPSVIRLLPQHYVYVSDFNSNVTRVEIGPKTFTRADHERVVAGPMVMTIIPPNHYAVIQNPALRDADGEPVVDKSGQIRLRHGDEEIRFQQEPFALLPGEKMPGKVLPLTVVRANTALRLTAVRDFDDYVTDDEWLFHGPGTYTPRVEVKVVETVKAVVIKPNQALRLRARRETKDCDGIIRKDGEEWLVRREGAYLPGVYEEVVSIVKAYILTDSRALGLRAIKTFTDRFNKNRKAGEEWIITTAECESHIPDIYEEVTGEIKITTLTNRQYCYVLNPYRDGKNQLGTRVLRKGETSFFLLPGESLESGIQSIHVLSEESGLLLKAVEAFSDDSGEETIQRRPGDLWLITGPCEYVPPVTVKVVERRSSTALDVNEGIYVRDTRSGHVRSVIGETYMLKWHETLWEKDLPQVVENLLARDLDPSAGRGTNAKTTNTSVFDFDKDGNARRKDKSRVVTFRAPHNSAVQVYDFKKKAPRIVFGPDLVLLGPDEMFTVLSLSGGKPKKPNFIKSICLLLGPDFLTDYIVVETADHARLQLQLSYNWHFEVKRDDQSAKCFQVADFVGNTAASLGSRIRAAVASCSFDEFHRNSARVIRHSVFGVDSKGSIKDFVHFPENDLYITNVDIQSVEPVDVKTREELLKSVQLAISITTNAQEATARHEAERLEQEARGRLERQRIKDEAEAESNRRQLLELQAQAAAVESTGQAKAEAQARAEAAQIEGEAAVTQARLRAQAMELEAEGELNRIRHAQENEVSHQKAVNEIEITRARELASIEAKKFKDVVDAIGADTITAIARAGPEMQAKLLQGLGLNGYLITDGSSPINLFNTASGLIGANGAPVVPVKNNVSSPVDSDEE